MIQVKIIPTVFALDSESFNKKLDKLIFSKILHLDFMDGVFTKNKSVEFADYIKIREYKNIFFEAHLMAYNPTIYLEQIINFNIKKVLIQFEVFKTEDELKDCIHQFKKNNIQFFLVINPQTEVGDFIKFVPLIDGVMFMSVIPGAEGQKFIEYTLEKIRHLRMLNPKIDIQIDGGIKEENIEKVIRAGANIINVGSYISSVENPQQNFGKLNKLINEK